MNRSSPKDVYIAAIAIVGLAIIVFGVPAIIASVSASFLLLLLLAIATRVVLTVITPDVNYSISTPVSLAAIPNYGLPSAIIVGASAELVFYLIQSKQHPNWRHSIERIFFNTGMVVITLFIAGLVYLAAGSWFGGNFWGQILPWLLAAIVANQVNLWLLIGIVSLANNKPVKELWGAHNWTILIDILITAVGGGLLSLAIVRFDWLGIVIFFLPIAMSSYAFRLYVTKTRAEMDKLEDIVNQRTRELRQALASLQQEQKYQDYYVATLTHELRSPLSGIIGHADLLRRGYLGDLPPEARESAESIFTTGDHMLCIVNDILEIARLKTGTLELKLEEVDITAVCREVLAIVEPMAGQKPGLELRAEMKPRLRPVLGDATRLRQVLLNLVTNAIKFTQAGCVILTVAPGKGASVVIRVQDTGPGIAPEYQEKIFEPFVQVPGQEQALPGTGLGLAITRQIVAMHRGTISVTSEVGRGSLFAVTLPTAL
jgi:signal transduction histidine kinase